MELHLSSDKSSPQPVQPPPQQTPNPPPPPRLPPADPASVSVLRRDGSDFVKKK